MIVKKVQLICTTANVGRGANDGVYYPAGLLTLARALQSEGVEVIVEQDHRPVAVIGSPLPQGDGRLSEQCCS